MGSSTMAEVKNLQLDAVIGYEGSVPDALTFHPDGRHLIYPLGSAIVIRDLASSHSQRYLHGHKDRVSCVALSPTGKYIASGQVTHMGFTAPIIVWDFETGAPICGSPASNDLSYFVKWFNRSPFSL